jgi:hypothetical protein
MESKLDLILKTCKKHICIKYNDGTVDRVLLQKAHQLVSTGSAKYIPKSEYKEKTRIAKKEKPIVESVEQEVQEVKVKLKAKEIRAKNKKQK